jgi:hypothetical protein
VELIWTVVGVVVSILISVGASVLGYTPPEFKLARACFWTSAVMLGLTEIAWQVQTTWSLPRQLWVAIPLGTLILTGLPAGLRWVQRRETVYISLCPKPSDTATGAKLFDQTGREIRYEARYPGLPTRRRKIGYVLLVIVIVTFLGAMAGNLLYTKLLKIPALTRFQSRAPAPPPFAYDHTPSRTARFRPKDATACTMRNGTYYPDYRLMPGGPKLQRPMVVINAGAFPIGTAMVAGDTLMILKLALTNRGEASIVKNWELCLVQNGKPVIYENAEMPIGMLINGTETVTQEKSLVDTAIRAPIEHAHTVGGYVAFKVTKEVADSWTQGKPLQGAIRFKDYLDHKLSFDFAGTNDGKPWAYMPGAPR